ncbi:hypothetical protein AB0L74_13245 [Streptomyces sp. NPDC052020]|uniref:hypothetical protein n=1 Tax=Streptomyces sp. NPDC052020 TaxID=3155677 RepID=UPI00343C8B8A
MPVRSPLRTRGADRARALATGASAALLAAVSVTGLAPQAAAEPSSPAAAQTARAPQAPQATVPWSVSHGTATASGDRWTERGSTGFPDLVIRGTLANSGTECYSVWFRWMYDLAPAQPRKHVSQCGTGTAPVETRLFYLPTYTGSVAVCRGTTDTSDCGPWQSVTSWPVGG